MIKTIIVDDEHTFTGTLSAMLNAQFPSVNIIAEANGVDSGVSAIEEHKPDLVFLDVEMEDGTGFDLLKQVDFHDFLLVFVTAYDHYAVEAFKFSAIDYLLKPLSSDQLKGAMDKVIDALDKKRINHQLSVLFHNMDETSYQKKKVVLKEADKMHIIRLEDILWCHAESSYTVFHLTNGKKIIVSNHLKQYESLFSNSGFFRAHRSHLVNIHKIIRLERGEGGTIFLEGEIRVPVSTRRKDELTAILSNL